MLFRFFVCLVFLANVSLKADEFIYSFKIGESLNSVRGKLDISFTTTSLGWTIVSIPTIPGAPRYVTNSTLLFYEQKLAGAVFTINPRISEFDSYEERSKFLINSYTVLAKRLNDKYSSLLNETQEYYVSCPNSKSYDYSNCNGEVHFYDKHKLIELLYTDNKMYMYIASAKKFKKIEDMYTSALLSIYSSHVGSFLREQEYKDSLKAKEGIILDEKSYELESAEIEIAYSELP